MEGESLSRRSLGPLAVAAVASVVAGDTARPMTETSPSLEHESEEEKLARRFVADLEKLVASGRAISTEEVEEGKRLYCEAFIHLRGLQERSIASDVQALGYAAIIAREKRQEIQDLCFNMWEVGAIRLTDMFAPGSVVPERTHEDI